MAEIDHSNTILIVKPVGPAALDALRSEYNISRLVSFHFEDGASSISQYDDPRSRECTPYVSRPSEMELHLKFDPKPKDATRGFVFGTDETDDDKEKKCDVVLLENPDPQKIHGISKQHFSINFNWKSGFLRLNNISRNGTGMGAPSVKNGYQMLKYNNMHMLHPAEQTKIHVGDLVFEVSFPERGMYQRQYEMNWEAFRREFGDDVPKIEGLDIQPTRKITQLFVRRESRHNAYFLHDEIGKGQFGSVCKASDYRTGEVFAAKQYTTRKPGWDAKAYLEITISQKITHKHIVSFVDSIDDGGGPVLVMEYMLLGNLTELNKVRKISSDEMRIVLRQTLQALAYLHDEKKITHRDIKPENILVRSRTPELFIKLCDFGLSTEKRILQTQCGTLLYTAPEISTGPYTNAVDIWAIGVVSYQFIKGLPTYPKKFDSKEWSKIIRQTVDCADRQGKDPVVRLLKRMLELKPLDRPSAKNCLSDPWIRSATPTVQPGTEPDAQLVGRRSPDTISEQPTEILDPLWQVTDGSILPNQLPVLEESRKRLRSSKSTSRTQATKKVQKRLQAETSSGSNITDMLVEEIYKSDRKEKETRAPTRDTRGTSLLEGVIRIRERTYEHEHDNTDTESPHTATRTLHVGYDGEPSPAFVEMGLPIVQIPAGQRGQESIWKRAGCPIEKLSPTNEDIPQVIDFDTEHVQMRFEDKIILLRKDDCFLNATQIIKLASKSKSERQKILTMIKEATNVDVHPPSKSIPYPCSWIDFRHGRALCKFLELEQELQPLLNYGQRLRDLDRSKSAEQGYDYLKKSRFLAVPASPAPVMVRKSDLRVNATQILRAAGQNVGCIRKIRTDNDTAFDTVRGNPQHQGTYVDLRVGVELCEKYGLIALTGRLRHLQDENRERVHGHEKVSRGPYAKRPDRHECISRGPYVEICGFAESVMIRASGFRVNATHILKLADQSRHTGVSIRKRLTNEEYDIVKGVPRCNGTYVDFQIAIDLCGKYGLAELEEQLHIFISTREATVWEVKPDHAGSLDRTSNGVRETRRLNSGLLQDLAHELRAESGSSSEESAQEDVHKTVLIADVTSSGIKVPGFIQDIQSQTSELLSAHPRPNTASPRQSGTNAGYTLLGLPTSPVTGPSYEVWDEKPQTSHLIGVKPELRPPVRQTVSPYGSFRDSGEWGCFWIV